MLRLLTSKILRQGGLIIAAFLALWGRIKWAERKGYNKAKDDQKEATQQARERANEVENDVRRADDDSLVDGLHKSDRRR